MESLTGKTPGSQLTATEWNQVPQEMQNIITDLGLSLSSGDLDQLGKAIAGFLASGDFYSESGGADAYVVSPIGSKQGPASLLDGMTVRFRPGNVNTGASTINVNSLGVKAIKREDGTDVGAGDLGTTRDAWLRYDGTDFLLSNWTGSGDLAELSGQFEWTGGGSSYTLNPGIGKELIINVNGARLVRNTPLVFDFGDLDTGSEEASKAYYLYIKNVAGVMTPIISATVPVGEFGGKVGYHGTRTDERCVLGVWNNTDSDFVLAIHTAGGLILFMEHDSDHEHDLLEATSTAWRHVSLNLPHTATSVLFTAGASFTSGDGMAVWGRGNAEGALAGGSMDPRIASDILFFGNTTGTSKTTYQLHGEIPMVTRWTPSVKYGLTNDVENHFMIVNGYRDLFAPKM